MTDDDIRRQIELMKSIDRQTVHLPIATVERLMATGHKIKIGKASTKGGKVKPADTAPTHVKIARKGKADTVEKGLRNNRQRAKG